MTLLLNRLNVLDKGFIALLSASNNGLTLKNIEDQYYKSAIYKDLAKISQVTFIIKCPMFVQLYLTRFNFTIITLPAQGELEAYIPDESEISAQHLEDSQVIKDSMQRTTAALLINPEAYQKDNCDRYISQILTPISVYSELLISGSLGQWVQFINKKNKLPAPIEAYRTVIEDILQSEWLDLDNYR